MKRKIVALPYCLPNHQWTRLGVVRDETHIVRKVGGAVLFRRRAWNKRPKYDWTMQFCGRNKPSINWRTDSLYVEGQMIVDILFQKAESGIEAAALELARLATESTVALTRIARSKPELLHQLARLHTGWPVIKQRRERLSGSERTLFANIHLGGDSIIEQDPATAKWKMDDAGKIAYSLLEFMDNARKSRPDSSFDYGRLGKALRRLPAFCDESAVLWWGAAKDILLFSYPKPQSIIEFDQLVLPASKRKSPGRIRQAILDMLKARFLSFARNISYPT